MKNLFVAAGFAVVVLFSCSDGNKTPDVSGIKVTLNLHRFDKDFFAIDSNRIDTSLSELQKKYPTFFTDYLGNILGINRDMIEQGTAPAAIKYFLASYKPLYDSVQKTFGSFDQPLEEIKKMLQYVRYYFPAYQVPSTVVTFIGPLDASFKTTLGVQGDILTPNELGVGLQLHLGAASNFYTSQQGQELYPLYISKRFEHNNIALNLAKTIVDDLHPEAEDDKPLISRMVDNGKRLYLLERFTPKAPAHQLIGYTKEQLEGCYKNEALIWDFFIKNNFLQRSDKNVVDYINEGPKTQELGETAPGNIGSFCGWQIVKKYMANNPSTTMPQLLAMDNEQLFQTVKYKP
ncbi:MAG TPA: hypothetical protein PKC39_00390 [Ferruginibacter sp.]|nr:hypothetical protein [Ferruginibacter sp.]HMP19388.1 hypothetical protein [Ferruginibacter sp.]